MSLSKILVVWGIVMMAINFMALHSDGGGSVEKSLEGFRNGQIIWMFGVTFHIFSGRIHRKKTKVTDG